MRIALAVVCLGVLAFGCKARQDSTSESKAIGSISASALDSEPQTKTTLNGAVFTRVSRQELRAAGVVDPDAFGFPEAWRDPSGVIWGDVSKNADGSFATMDHFQAEAHCRRLGAQLPSGWPESPPGAGSRDSDFVRLRKYLGAGYAAGDEFPTGYKPQILPNQTYINQVYEVASKWEWSSTLVPNSYNAWAFLGSYGRLYHRDILQVPSQKVARCVANSVSGSDTPPRNTLIGEIPTGTSVQFHKKLTLPARSSETLVTKAYDQRPGCVLLVNLRYASSNQTRVVPTNVAFTVTDVAVVDYFIIDLSVRASGGESMTLRFQNGGNCTGGGIAKFDAQYIKDVSIRTSSPVPVN
jgi:hypothetical protein